MNALPAEIPGGLLSGDRDEADHLGVQVPADHPGVRAGRLIIMGRADRLGNPADHLTARADHLGDLDLIKDNKR